MNLLDVAIAALCLGFAAYGIFQGVVRQAFSLGGLIVGHLAGVKWYASARANLNLDFPHSHVVAYVLVFLVFYLLVRLAGLIVERLVRGSPLSGTDRFAGMLAGLVKGALLSVLLVFVLVIVLPRDTAVFSGSRFFPAAMAGARLVQKAFPERLREAFREKAGVPPAAPSGKKGSPEGR